MSPSKASREKHRVRYLAWQDARYPDATREEKIAMHDAHKAAMMPWRARRERYAALPMQPLRVVADAHAPLVDYDRISLAGLLAWTVVMEETEGRGVEIPPRYTPLPLEVAGYYGSGGQLPLWRASAFAPVNGDGRSFRHTEYVHKRAPRTVTANQSRVDTSTGRWMERRIPLPLRTAPAWEAYCYGNAAEIERLLTHYVICLGKRRNIGYGEVVGWWVQPWAEAGDPLVQDGKLAHAIPEAHAAAAGYVIDEPPVLVGWTPPQWQPAFWALGWPVGTPVQVDPPPLDYFAAADGLGGLGVQL